MSAASNYTETLALTWLLTASAATRPSNWHIAAIGSVGVALPVVQNDTVEV